MAIMKQCCCCGVRSGSTACGIYSLVIAILGVLVFSYDMYSLPATKEALIYAQEELPEVFGDLDIDSYVCLNKTSYILGLVFLVSVFFTSIFLMVGISKDAKGMLIPFMVSKGLGLFWYVFAFSVGMYGMVQLGMEYAGFTVLGFLIVLGPFFAADIVCLLCVLSQYQEYRDGRGRLCDNIAQRQTTIIVQQQSLPSGAGGFAYQPMQNPPPYASAPPTQKPGAI